MQTLDLYHNQIVDPRLVAIAFHDLTEKHPDAEIEIISIEKKGKNNDRASYAEGDYYNNSQQQQSLAAAAAEIQQLLDQLSQTYPTDTTTGKMAVATAAIEQIDRNPNLTKRILSALKAGSVEAFAQALNHPAASFVIGALEDWQKGKES